MAEWIEQEAEAIGAEGWRWLAIGQEAQMAAWNLRRVWPNKVALSAADEARRSEFGSRHDEIAEEHNGSGDDLPEDVAAKLDRIEAELAELEAREEAWRPTNMARAGVVVTLAVDGSLRIERDYVRPEHEARPEPMMPDESGTEAEGIWETGTDEDAGEAPVGSGTVTPFRPTPEPEDKAPVLSAALLAEFEAHRTAGLLAAIAPAA